MKKIVDESEKIYDVNDLLYVFENNPDLVSFVGFENYYLINYYRLYSYLFDNYKIYRIVNLLNSSDENFLDFDKIVRRNVAIREDIIRRTLTIVMIRKYVCNYANMSKLSGDALLFSWVPKELVLQIAKLLYKEYNLDIYKKIIKE